MKFGLRAPSVRKRIAARTSWKRVILYHLHVASSRGWSLRRQSVARKTVEHFRG